MIGVVADTHDNVPAVRRAVATFEDRGVETVVHCGDYVAPPVVSEFDGLDLHGVLGNNDGELDGLERAFRSIGGQLHGRFADLTLGGLRVAVLHGEDREAVDRWAREGAPDGDDYDIVCYGHHHERDHRQVGGTTVLNPGAQFPTVPDEHRTVALLDPSGAVEFVGIAD